MRLRLLNPRRDRTASTARRGGVAFVLAAIAVQACITPRLPPARVFHPLRDAELPYEVGALWTRPEGYGRAAQNGRGYHRRFPPTEIHEARRHLWDADCTMHFDTAYLPPARHVCLFEAKTSTAPDVSVVLLGDDLRALDGIAIATTATATTTWFVLHDPAARAAVITSSTAALVARIALVTGQLEVAPDLSVEDNRWAELIGLAVLATPPLAPLRPPKTPAGPPVEGIAPDETASRRTSADGGEASFVDETETATTSTPRRTEANVSDETETATASASRRTSDDLPGTAAVPIPRYPDARPLRTRTSSVAAPFDRHARALEALGNVAHAAALRAALGAPLDGPPATPGRPVPAPRPPANEGGLAFGVGLEAGPNFPITSGDVRLKQGAELRVPFFMNVERRLQIAFFVGTYARLLDGPATLRANDLDGRFEALSGYSSGGTTVNGISTLGLGARYMLTDWAFQPYVGAFGATRFEAHQYVDAGRTFRVDLLMPALEIAPVIGIRHLLWRGEFTAVDLRTEAVGHTIFMRRPALAFEGDASVAALDTYERLRALDFGGPAFQLAFLVAIDVWFGGVVP